MVGGSLGSCTGRVKDPGPDATGERCASLHAMSGLINVATALQNSCADVRGLLSLLKFDLRRVFVASAAAVAAIRITSLPRRVLAGMSGAQFAALLECTLAGQIGEQAGVAVELDEDLATGVPTSVDGNPVPQRDASRPHEAWAVQFVRAVLEQYDKVSRGDGTIARGRADRIRVSVRCWQKNDPGAKANDPTYAVALCGFKDEE